MLTADHDDLVHLGDLAAYLLVPTICHRRGLGSSRDLESGALPARLLEEPIVQVFVVIRIEAHEDADVRHGSPGISFLLAGLGADRADRVELELLLGSMKLLERRPICSFVRALHADILEIGKCLDEVQQQVRHTYVPALIRDHGLPHPRSLLSILGSIYSVMVLNTIVA